MTLSIWRYAHLTLALISSIFLVMASVTGAILSINAIQERAVINNTNHNNVTIAETIKTIQKNYSEISIISIDDNQQVTVEGFDNDDNQTKAIIDPKTGKTIGKPQKKSEFINWVTSLHRSLFLHETGRLFVGINCFLLLLIAGSGTVLIIQRQKNFMRFFSKVVKDYFFQYYHVIAGRLLLIPILIIAGTGTYLSLVRFKVFPEVKTEHKTPKITDENPEQKDFAQFPIFKDTKLSDVKKIEFPFPDDPEEFYNVKLKDKEVLVDQFNGSIVSEVKYPKTVLLENLSLDLHTGRTSILWAIILGIASINILFFIISGFGISLRRKSVKIKNKYKAEDAKIVILVGSETGSTTVFADNIHRQLLSTGYTSYITFLNQYKNFPKAEYIIILTSTYGVGDAPNNGDQFLNLIKKTPQNHDVKVSVVGFGSKSYEKYCGFAQDIFNEIENTNWATHITKLYTVNDKSPQDFALWTQDWNAQTSIILKTTPAVYDNKPKNLQKIMVLEKTNISETENSFFLTLKLGKNVRFTSGDLLAIYPENNHKERLYSIAKIDGNIQLKVKYHPNGLGSEFIHQLKAGSTINARIIENKNFHFPKKTNKVVMIANGTGIAPFLGMIHQNTKHTECHLYCGFRQETEIIKKHQDFAKKHIDGGKLQSFHIAFSREQNHCYVMDLIERDADFFVELLSEGGIIMICGALQMQKDVEATLSKILEQKGKNNFEFYKNNGQLQTDCY